MKTESISKTYGQGGSAGQAQKAADTKLSLAVKNQKPAALATRQTQSSLTAGAMAWVIIGVSILVALATLAISGGWDAVSIEMGSETAGVLIQRAGASGTP
jgi:hypothetical protein